MKTFGRYWKWNLGLLLLFLLFAVWNAPSHAQSPPTKFPKQIPKLFTQEAFTCDMLAEAVNHYVSLGEGATIKELSALSPSPFDDHSSYVFDLDERIYWVCRILFEPKSSKPLREMGLGAPAMEGVFQPSKNWPLFPVVASGSSFFIFSQGYVMLGGMPETTPRYLDYCRSHGTFRRKPVPVPTRAQALRDFQRLRTSRSWRAIHWKDDQESDELFLLKPQIPLR